MTAALPRLLSALLAIAVGCGAPISESSSHHGDASGGATGGASTSPSDSDGAVEGGPVDISGVFNARHLGTLPANGRRLRDRILLRSGDLFELSETGCSTLAALNVRTVIDLRDEPDLSNRPDAGCTGAQLDSVSISLPKLLPPSDENYLSTLTAAESRLSELVTAVVQAPDATLIHCVIGRDRATLVTALLLLAAGVETSTVLADATTNQDASITVDSSWFEGVLSRLEDAGGIDAYLLQHEVSSAQLEALREKLTEPSR